MRYIFPLVVIIACIGVFFAIVKPKYDNLQTIRDEVANYGSSLDTAEQLRISREELIAKYNNIPKADLDNLKTLLPDSVDNIRLIIQIDSIATRNNLSPLRNVEYSSNSEASSNLSSVDASSTIAPGNPIGEITMSFQTQGTYQNFLAFLSDLEHNLRIVDVTAIDFGEATEGESGATTNPSYKVTLKTYWLRK